VSAPRLAEDAEVMARLAALGGGQPRSPLRHAPAAQAALDADVTSKGAARSQMELVADLTAAGA
jgi:hypothetical protein